MYYNFFRNVLKINYVSLISYYRNIAWLLLSVFLFTFTFTFNHLNMYLAAFFLNRLNLVTGTKTILLSLSLIACSCSNVKIRQTLSRAEDLMSEHPDSALSILEVIDHDNMPTKALRARYSLLLSMALDKNYIDVTNDSTARISFDYYKHHGNKRDKMLSFYYLGVIHQNAGDDLQATIEFDETLNLAKELSDYHYCGLACRHLSSIHAHNYNHVLSLKYAEETAHYFDMCGDKLSADYGRINMAEQMIFEGHRAEAEAIIDNVLSTNNHLALIKVASWLKVDCLIAESKYDEASIMLTTLSKDASTLEKLLLNTYESLLHQIDGETEKADISMKIAKLYIQDSVDSLTFLNQQVNIQALREDYFDAFSSLNQAVEIQNRQTSALLSQSITYALEQHYRESFDSEKAQSKLKSIIIAFILLLAALLSAILISLVSKQRRNNIQLMSDIDTLNNDMELLRANNGQFKTVSDSLLRERVQFLKQLSNSYFEWTDEEVKKREKHAGTQTKDEIISTFRRQLGELRSDDTLFSSLEQAVNYSKDNILEKLRTVCKGTFKENDFRTLTLLFTGLSIRSSAFLLKTSEPALRTRKTRYKHYFETLPEPYASLFAENL